LKHPEIIELSSFVGDNVSVGDGVSVIGVFVGGGVSISVELDDGLVVFDGTIIAFNGASIELDEDPLELDEYPLELDEDPLELDDWIGVTVKTNCPPHAFPV
jgi:hypothetical protein